jgi:N-dimethylarginine dimethylaminohydrolase
MTAQSEVGRLARVLMKHPAQAFISQASIAAQWRALNFVAAPDLLQACREFDALVGILEDLDVSVDLLGEDARTGLDSIYVRDASLPTDAGIVLCRMGKALRSGEPGAQHDALSCKAWPILGSIGGTGRLEGGDACWLDQTTLLVGEGYRTNAEGILQLRTLLGPSVEVVAVPLPHWNGTDDVMHLMSLISPLTLRHVLVYSRLLPVPFRRWLLDRGLSLIEVPDEEFESMGGNVLSVGEGVVLALSGNPRTRHAIERHGITVAVYEGGEISLKGAGGPTCLSRPLSREP